MTELRRRMDDDMVARGLAKRTRESYLWAVTGLARFYRRPPDQMTNEEVQAYLVHLLRERQLSSSTCNVAVSGLRFFYHITLKRAPTTFDIALSRRPGKLPAILSRPEVEHVIAHATNPKHRTMLLTTYAAGLRLNEVRHLRVTDVDSTRMTTRVEQGKGGKDRYTVLSSRLLDALRWYWKLAHPRPWLFPSDHTGQPMDPSALQRAYQQAKRRAYRQTHRLATVQHRALRAITACRTAALGGHRETCDRCGATRITSNSCRNRHCPKCQALPKERWLAARTADLLPIPYFHVVFTLPHALNTLAQGNPRVLYALLFRAAADTLLTFGHDPRHLGGTIGMTAILHTWGQTLTQHLHLHCLVTGGALAADGSRWIGGRSSFLFPVRAMATVFRAKYLAGLRRAFIAGELTFAAGTTALADGRAFTGFLGQLRGVDWVVYAKSPFAGPASVLDYLGRYTHRVALSNDRLVDDADGRVRFRWRDYADHDRVKVMALDVEEFLRRFLLHVLPRGFMRIRHFGLLANRTRRECLTRCRDLLAQPPPAVVPTESAAHLIHRVLGIDLWRCPVCRHGQMLVVAVLAPAPIDSS